MSRTGQMRRPVLARPQPMGWWTSDEDEIALRRWRGQTEIRAVEILEPEHPLFGAFRVRSGSGGVYEVEIRDLEGGANSCGCVDHRVSGLGTCKHIEGVLMVLRKGWVRAYWRAAAAGRAVSRQKGRAGAHARLAGGRWRGFRACMAGAFPRRRRVVSGDPAVIDGLPAAAPTAPPASGSPAIGRLTLPLRPEQNRR